MESAKEERKRETEEEGQTGKRRKEGEGGMSESKAMAEHSLF